MALNKYRTYTLHKNVRLAEAYNLLNSSELKSRDQIWQKKVKKLVHDNLT